MDEGGSFIFCDNDYTQTAFCALRDMKDKEEYTDITITCRTRMFSAHRVVLAAKIPHFRKMLSTDDRAITLDEIDPVALESIINFAYEGKLKITVQNVQVILLASGYFKLDQVQKACWEFLAKKFSPNCEYSAWAKPVPCDSSIRQKFDDFSNTVEFSFLPYSMVKELLTRDDLVVTGEEKVFEALMRWIKSNLPGRQPFLPHLLTEIRMAHLTPDYLVEKVETEQLIQASDQCKHIVDEAKNYHLLPRKRSTFLSFKSCPRIYADSHQNPESNSDSSGVANPNIPITYKNGIYVICCQDSLGTCVGYYDHENKKWSILPSSASDDTDIHGAVFIEGKIFAFFQKSLKALCLGNLEWSTVGELPVAVDNSGIAACGFTGKIYIFGGRRLPNKVRCFDVRLGEWQQDKEMKIPRRNMGVASAGRYVYLSGGYINSCCNVFEEYDTITNQWTLLPIMLSSRMFHGCAKLNHKIYICGGLGDGDQVLNTAEVYDKRTKQWTLISSPKICCCSVSLVSWDGKLYGFAAERSDKDICLIYAPENNRWIRQNLVRPDGKHAATMKAVVVCPSEEHKVSLVNSATPMEISP